MVLFSITDGGMLQSARSFTSAHVRRQLRQKTWQQLSGMASSPPDRTPRQIGHLSVSSASVPSGGPWPPEQTDRHIINQSINQSFLLFFFLTFASWNLTTSCSSHVRPRLSWSPLLQKRRSASTWKETLGGITNYQALMTCQEPTTGQLENLKLYCWGWRGAFQSGLIWCHLSRPQWVQCELLKLACMAFDLQTIWKILNPKSFIEIKFSHKIVYGYGLQVETLHLNVWQLGCVLSVSVSNIRFSALK